MKDEEVLVWLTSFDFLTYTKKKKLLELFNNSPTLLFKNLSKKSQEIITIIESDNYSKLLYACTDEFLKSYLSNLESLKIKYITINSKEYPKKLLRLDEPPFVLFYKGNINILLQKSVAIVGTRSPSFYGKWASEHFAKDLANNHVSVVSGLAYGTDTIAHTTALSCHGKTIAVLPCGLANIYPASNSNLADSIAKDGLVLSEYKPTYIPNSYDFPQRNRIIAAISDCVIITEAGEKSGTYHTLNFSLKIGTEVFIVPGNINSKTSLGSNRMLKSCQAGILIDSEQILEFLNIKPASKQEILKNQVAIEDEIILKLLADGEKSFEYLQEKSQMEAKKLNCCLTNLQLLGIISKLPGNTFTLN